MLLNLIIAYQLMEAYKLKVLNPNRHVASAKSIIYPLFGLSNDILAHISLPNMMTKIEITSTIPEISNPESPIYLSIPLLLNKISHRKHWSAQLLTKTWEEVRN